jgi:glutathione S-transferase
MITIYGVYRSRALRNIWFLEEAGVPFRHVPVIQAGRVKNPDAPDAPLHSRHPEYLKINPNGGIPAMDDDGFTLSESFAINFYLARTCGLPVGTDDMAESARFAQWSLFGATEIEPHAIQILYNRVQKPAAERSEAKVAEAIAALAVPMQALDRALAANGHLVGGRFTVADINVAEVVRYAMPAPEVLDAAPNVKAWLAACHARPAWKKIWARREEEPAM